MFIPTHPGEVLREGYFKPEGLSVTEIARKLGVSRSTLSALLNERSGMSPQMAIRLTKVFPNQSARFWLNLQTNHDLALEMQRHGMKSELLAK